MIIIVWVSSIRFNIVGTRGSDKQKKVQDKSPPTAELLLRMFPGQQAPQDTLRCRKPSRLELWAQVNSRHQKQLMQSLEFFVKVG